MGVELFSSNADLLMAWLISLVFTAITAFVAGLFPKQLERVRKSAFAVMIFPGLVIALIYAFRGFGTLERPIVHWVFEKGAQDALHVGLVFDPLSFAVAIFTGAATMAICFRNRPTIRMSAALALSWLALGLAASSQTIWMAAIGIGIQFLARTFPIVEMGETQGSDEARWVASTKRAWVGLLSLLTGASGLSAQGIRLDFFSETAWSALENNPSTWVSGGLLIFGLLVMAAPVFASSSLFSPITENVEENIFVTETSLAWIAVIIIFRILGNLHEPAWLLAIGVGAAVATAGSLASLTFQSSKNSSIHLWLSTLPVATLMVLAFVPAREATLYLLGSLLASNGLWISLDHRRSRMDIAAAAAFLLAAFGFMGWSTSAGLANFLSKFEAEPFLRGPIFIMLLLYSAFGWRLALRGGEREEPTASSLGKWIVAGLFFVVGFGPLLSGRWGGGSIPGEPDWIEGAKSWGWIKAGLPDTAESDWAGFGIAQSLTLVSALIGIFAWRTTDLFPFATKYPRGAQIAKGLFGLRWLQEASFRLVRRAGSFLNEKISSPAWERGIPLLVRGLLSGFRKTGSVTERLSDPLTANAYGRVFVPAAKLVQWLHDGNVRLYAWFALIWILIFSIYLTR